MLVIIVYKHIPLLFYDRILYFYFLVYLHDVVVLLNELLLNLIFCYTIKL